LFRRRISRLVSRSWLRSGALGLIACVCVALIGIEAWQLWRVHAANIAQNQVVTANLARSIAEQAETTLKTADTIGATLVERVEAEGTGPESVARLYRLMTSLAAALPAIHEMGITDAQGNAIVKSLVPDSHGLNYAERAYFRYHATHTDRTPFIGARVQSKIDGTYNITVTHRIDRPDGSFGGVVVTSVSLQFFQHLFDAIQARSGGVIALLVDDGSVLVRSPALKSDISTPVAIDPVLRDQAIIGSVSYTSPIDGVQRRGSFQRLTHFPLVALVAQSEWDLQSGWRSELQTHAVILACVLIVLAFVGRRVVRANHVLQTQAMQDGLTGLANRRFFEETIEHEFRRAARSAQPISLIMIDIDHFKDYNDCYGHLVGDECLRAIAATIQGCLRRAGDFAARYGGEEIAVVLPATDASRAAGLARSMQASVHALALQHSSSPHRIVTFSAGIATRAASLSIGEWRELMADADVALYAAKMSGRDQVQTFPPTCWPNIELKVREVAHASASKAPQLTD
jgi:diguanylate cyclase (GGDEF)-like protein